MKSKGKTLNENINNIEKNRNKKERENNSYGDYSNIYSNVF